jgi:WD40 repeat protein/tRNA A-37 threonylcarbamoyl transferase component Bud32
VVRIPGYQIDRAIGRGGSSIVYRARNAAGKDVAVKVLQRYDAERVSRFERERRLLQSFGENEGFVPLLDAGECDSGLYLVLPYLPGGSLRDRLTKGPLSVDETAALGKTLATTLGNAHRQGIVHRDVKPENIVFSADGRPLVLDLGLAKHFWDDASLQSVSLSKTGDFLGTFAYMSPEQLVDSKNVDPQCDVFALGAILYECLTGMAAFAGDTTIDVMVKIRKGAYTPPRQLRPEAPPWLLQVIERALSLDRTKRFPDGQAFAAALEARQASRRAGVITVVALLVGFAAIAATTIAMHSAPPQPKPDAGAPPPPPPPSKPDIPAPEVPSARPVHAIALDTPWLRFEGIWGSYAGRHTSMIQRIAYSPDGRVMASCGVDGSLRLWRASDLEPISLYRVAQGNTFELSFTPDSKRVLAALPGNVAVLVDVATGAKILELTGHEDQVMSVAVLADGKRAITAAKDGRAGLWDLATGQRVLWFALQEGLKPQHLAAFPDGRSALVACDRTIVEVDLVTGRPLRSFEAPGESLGSLAISRDGSSAAAAVDKNLAVIWDVATGKVRHLLRGHTDVVQETCFSPDGKHLATGSFDFSVRTWSVATGEQELAIKGRDWISGVAWSPDGKTIAVGGNAAMIDILDATTGALVIPVKGHRGGIGALAVTADGGRVLTGGWDKKIHVWDASQGTELRALDGPGLPVTAIAVAPDGRHALSGGGVDRNPEDPVSELLYWDLEAGPVRLTGPKAPVHAVTFVEEGGGALSAGWTNHGFGEAIHWTFGENKATGAPVKGARAGALSLALESDSRILAASPLGLEVWDLEFGEARPLIEGKPVIAVAHRGTHIVASRMDGKIGILDTSDAMRAAWLDGHATIIALAISSNEKYAVSAGEDACIRVWSLAGSGAELDSLDLGALEGDVATAVAVEPGGSFLVGTACGVVLRFRIRER